MARRKDMKRPAHMAGIGIFRASSAVRSNRACRLGLPGGLQSCDRAQHLDALFTPFQLRCQRSV